MVRSDPYNGHMVVLARALDDTRGCSCCVAYRDANGLKPVGLAQTAARRTLWED